jgi:hypothetical protein
MANSTLNVTRRTQLAVHIKQQINDSITMKYLIDKIAPTLIVAAILALVGVIGQVMQPGWFARLIGAVPYDAQIIIEEPGPNLVFSKQLKPNDDMIVAKQLDDHIHLYQRWTIRKTKD